MNWKIPFLDLRVEGEEKKYLLDAITAVMDHGQFILGPEVSEFENKIADYCKRRYAVGVNSGTDALYLGLKSLDMGVGDEVIVPALSWIATANAITMTGATPVFVDIGNDLNIDIASIKDHIGPRTRAILCVHYAGRMCDVLAIRAIAEENKILFLEDASQAFGAQRDGYVSGEASDVGMFSLNPMKVFNACGEAGVLVTNDEAVYQRVMSLRYNGMIDKVHCLEPGLNARIDTIQAAILLARFKHLEAKIQHRQSIAQQYSEGLLGLVSVPFADNEERHIYYNYIIKTPMRDALFDHLRRSGIEAKLRDPVLMPDQPCYSSLSDKVNYPNAKKLVNQLLSLPIHEKMQADDVSYVIQSIKEFINK